MTSTRAFRSGSLNSELAEPVSPAHVIHTTSSDGYIYEELTPIVLHEEGDDSDLPSGEQPWMVQGLAGLGIDLTPRPRRFVPIDEMDPTEFLDNQNDFVGFHVVTVR